ncbi:MAG: hypothetical protein E7580_02210 [Ruminococcaceae bacterium]|nr:hypothetical protein [Oscillospiraceae bacterium]
MKKKQLVTMIVLTVIAALLIAAFFYVANMYNQKGLALIEQWDKAYEYNGKLLLSEDRSEALRVWAMGQTSFDPVPLTQVDLTEFGFEGKKFSYYRVEVPQENGTKKIFLYTPEPELEGFWPVLKPERLIYTDEKGARYCIHPSEKLCYPMFSDSIKEVDPYGKDVLAFSENGSYAIGMTGDRVTVYHTDPTDDSLRVVDVKTVSFKKYKSVSFGAFVSDTMAYFKTAQGYVALDCTNGKLADSKLDKKGEYSQPICRLYAQRLDVKEEDKNRAVWSHLLLGTERKTPVLTDYSSFEIRAVSPGGKYIAMLAEGKTKEIMVSTEKRAFSLNSVLEKGMKVQRVDFVYENLIYVTLTDSAGKTLSRCYKVCF